MMRWAFLLVGFGAGLGVGLLVGGRETVRAGGRRAVVERPGNAPSPMPPPAPEPAPGPAPRDVLLPTGRIEAEAGESDPACGTLLVDFTGSHLERTAEVRGLGLRGEVEVLEEFGGDDDPVVEFELAPGTYPVVWRDGAGVRLGVVAKVEAGKVTRVDVAQGKPVPLPAGLGGIDVAAFGIDGKPLRNVMVTAAGIDMGGTEEELNEWAGTLGRARFEVKPGVYDVAIGATMHRASVQAGRRTAVEFRYTTEGELAIEGAVEGAQFQLEPLSGQRNSHSSEFGTTLYFVEPGEYALSAVFMSQGFDRRDLGRVVVQRGRRTVVDSGLPTGRLRVDLWPPGGKRLSGNPPTVELEATLPAMAPQRLSLRTNNLTRSGRPPANGYTIEFRSLTPGRYVVTVDEPAYKPVRREIAVASAPVELEISLERR